MVNRIGKKFQPETVILFGSHALRVVREWPVKADNDLTAAAQILKLGKAAPVETVCHYLGT
jgi:hypothetical protein